MLLKKLDVSGGSKCSGLTLVQPSTYRAYQYGIYCTAPSVTTNYRLIENYRAGWSYDNNLTIQPNSGSGVSSLSIGTANNNG